MRTLPFPDYRSPCRAKCSCPARGSVFMGTTCHQLSTSSGWPVSGNITRCIPGDALSASVAHRLCLTSYICIFPSWSFLWLLNGLWPRPGHHSPSRPPRPHPSPSPDPDALPPSRASSSFPPSRSFLPPTLSFSFFYFLHNLKMAANNLVCNCSSSYIAILLHMLHLSLN